MHAIPQFFMDFFGAREYQKTDRYFGITNSDGSVTLNIFLLSNLLEILHSCSLLVSVSMPENSGSKEEEREQENRKSRVGVQIQT
jgi:hypothetical protein